MSLFVFEAAARHLSFTRAAKELQISQPAVSQSVRRIEAALGTKLFHRRHRSIVLTQAGERFYHDVSLGLMRIKNSAEQMVLQSDESHVTISVSTAFANYWLVPRLSEFRHTNPDIDLRVQTTDKDIELGAESVSLAVRRGTGVWQSYDAFKLAPEEIIPVASPAFIDRHPAALNAQSLVSFDLIHLEEPYRPRPTWLDWFAFHGLEYTDVGDGLRLNDYALVLQAAMAGEGIALGWRHVVEGLIQQGLLAPVVEATYRKQDAFWVIWSNTVTLSSHAMRVRDWLQAQAVDSFIDA